jgi:hypothetical protein
MTRHLPSYRRARGEDGVALAWALAFLVLVGVVVLFVLDYTTTSIRSNTRLAAQRSALYAADGGVNTAIRYLQQNPGVGTAGDQCDVTDSGAGAINGLDVAVKCDPTSASGVPLGTSTAPGFAVLTMAPYHGAAPNNGCVNVNNELGMVQVQNSKLLQITGNVYVNSDADSDVWSGGCPQTSTAQHILVSGNVRQAESCHDIDVVPPYAHTCPLNGTVGSYPAAPDPATTDPSSWAANISAPPPTQSVPTCPATGNLVTLTPGTYTDAAGLTSLMSGGCPGKLFWFQPGDYYFDFGNGGHTWTIDDAGARVVGGAPNAVATGATPIGPVTVAATNPPAPTTNGYTNPNNALAVGGGSATTGTFSTTGTTRTLTTGGYMISPGIPGGSTNLTINARVVHSETFGTPSQLGALQLLVRNAADTSTLCTVNVPPSATSGATVDVQNLLIPNGCLDEAALNSGSFALRYQVSHASCSPSSSCTAISSSLDGIQLLVSYTAPARSSWDPADPTTVTATTPSVPGACVHDGDYGFNTNTGVQFVFGGDSHVVLQSGAVELCDSFSSTHQEIVLYGVKSGSAGGSNNATLRASSASGSNWTGTSSGTTINGSSATTTFSGTSGATRTITLTNYSPALSIDPASTNLTTTLRIAHSESNTSRITNPQIQIQSANGGTTYCTVSANPTTSLATQSLAIPAGCLTIARLNQGIRAAYAVTYACSGRSCGSSTASLDGIEFDVSWTPPGTSTGSLKPSSGCVVQTPYYSPQNHSPAYNGACALFSVASDGNGGHTPRVAVFWGTVYAPSAAMDVPVDVLTVPVFNRGVVARVLMLGYQVAANAQVPITTTPITATLPSNRRVVLTASIAGNEKLVADVELCDSACDNTHPAGSTKIWSWTVTR